MAAQWRIRHKLLFELVLMGFVMFLVVGGTVRGMWSYYLTTDAIRINHAELKSAEEFKEAVANIIASDKRGDYKRIPANAKPDVQAARNLIDRFGRELQDNLDHGRSSDADLLGWVAYLDKDLNEFESLVSNPPASMEHSGGELRTGADETEAAADGREDKPAAKVAKKYGQRVADALNNLGRDTKDLRDTINTQLENRLRETRRFYQTAVWSIVPPSVLGLVVLVGILRSFYTWVLHPLRDLETGVVRIAAGDFSNRIKVHSGDEMEDLGTAFNDMTDRLQDLYADLARQVNERSRQLVRSERLASVGFLAAGVAHEINNPLASIAFCSEALESRLGDLLRAARAAGRGEDFEVFAKYLKMIQDEAFRCKNITERLLEFSRTDERRRDPTDLRALVQSVLDLTQHLQNCRGKQLELNVQADRIPGGRILAKVNAEEIKSVVLNLVVNALDSMDEGGKLTITMGQRDGMAELKFTDTGCGMTQEVLDNIFEPFFTRSRSGKGTGLGLTLSHRIVTQHGGELEAASEGPSLGSTFTVRLPLQPVEQPVAPVTTELPAPRPRVAPQTRQVA